MRLGEGAGGLDDVALGSPTARQHADSQLTDSAMCYVDYFLFSPPPPPLRTPLFPHAQGFALARARASDIARPTWFGCFVHGDRQRVGCLMWEQARFPGALRNTHRNPRYWSPWPKTGRIGKAWNRTGSLEGRRAHSFQINLRYRPPSGWVWSSAPRTNGAWQQQQKQQQQQ